MRHQEATRFQHTALAVLLAGALLVQGIFPVTAQASGRVVTAASDSTLMVQVIGGSANAECTLQLGSGERREELPRIKLDDAGAGAAKWRIPKDAATGRRAILADCASGGTSSEMRGYAVIPASAGGNDVLTTVLNIALDVLLAGTLILFVVLLVDLVIREKDPRERLMRALALIAGAIIALGAQAADTTLASYTVDSLTGARPGGEGFKAVSAIVPGGLGVLFGWYFIRVMRRSAAMGLRLMSFLGMLTIISFAAIFAEATNTQGVFLGAAAIPNASFVVGLIGGVVIFMPTADSAGGREGGFRALRELLQKRPGGRSASVAPTAAEAGSEAKPATRNPFLED